jgi:DNA-binding MarR family transcriptional regulator/GNAT superfamily N-acetyltransferase
MALPREALSFPGDAIEAVRHFNRFYTRQIGLLDEHLLTSQFSLSEVRVLYELAHHEGITAAELAGGLGIDRGYLSRMLKRFASRGWIHSLPSEADGRRIFLSLTAKGKKVFRPLDRRSSQEVSSLLATLAPLKQRQLLGAMRQIEGVLSVKDNVAADFLLRSHRPGDMGWVVYRHGVLYAQEYGYDERFEALVAEIVAEFINNLDVERERCWIAERQADRVGSIFLVRKSNAVAKLRLLLVEPSARGLGIGARLVSECIKFARQAGYDRILLWTQSELHAARHLYQQAGFERIGEEPHQSWGRNDLVAETWELKL